jgi:hypothetical protein
MKKVKDRDILKDLIASGLGYIKFTDLPALAKIFERTLTVTLIDKKTKKKIGRFTP